MSATFDLTSPEFWIPSDVSGHIYTEDVWQGVRPATILIPRRLFPHPYYSEYYYQYLYSGYYQDYYDYYGYGLGSFWPDYNDSTLLSVVIRGTNRWDSAAFNSDLPVVVTLTDSYLVVQTTERSWLDEATGHQEVRITFDTPIALSRLVSIYIEDQGTDYSANNGYDAIMLELDVNLNAPFWNSYRNTFEVLPSE